MIPEGAIIVNDPSMTVCPKCVDDGCITKLVKARDGKYCEFHGKITGQNKGQ